LRSSRAPSEEWEAAAANMLVTWLATDLNDEAARVVANVKTPALALLLPIKLNWGTKAVPGETDSNNVYASFFG
jgi:hypothetical protein